MESCDIVMYSQYDMDHMVLYYSFAVYRMQTAWLRLELLIGLENIIWKPIKLSRKNS